MEEDLGVKFGRERSFSFDIFAIDEILFDDTDDITLYCRVPYFGVEYFATFGMTFSQLNTILRSIKTAASPIASAIADKLTNEASEAPITIKVEDVYNMTLEVNSVVLHTTLYELSDDEEEEDEMEEEEADDSEYVAYAFLVDEVEIIPPLS
jgi:hypothetical protein